MVMNVKTHIPAGSTRLQHAVCRVYQGLLLTTSMGSTLARNLRVRPRLPFMARGSVLEDTAQHDTAQRMLCQYSCSSACAGLYAPPPLLLLSRPAGVPSSSTLSRHHLTVTTHACRHQGYMRASARSAAALAYLQHFPATHTSLHGGSADLKIPLVIVTSRPCSTTLTRNIPLHPPPSWDLLSANTPIQNPPSPPPVLPPPPRRLT